MIQPEGRSLEMSYSLPARVTDVVEFPKMSHHPLRSQLIILRDSNKVKLSTGWCDAVGRMFRDLPDFRWRGRDNMFHFNPAEIHDYRTKKLIIFETIFAAVRSG
jgi:hypothetical protein